MEGQRIVYQILVGKPEEKRSLGRPSGRWKDGIRMYLMEIGWEDWIQLAQDMGRWRAVVNVAIDLWVPTPRS
jgi:hypothetical protein